MFENFSSKIKNLFKSKRNTVSTKKLDKLDNGLTIDDMIRYKNLIPNLLDEFVDQSNSNKRRANSFSLKNRKLTISEKSLIHSNSGLLKKLQKKIPKKANVRVSIGRHYFLGSTSEDAKHLTTKNVRRGSFPEKKGDIIIEKEEKEENEENKEQEEKKQKNEFSGLRANTIRFDKIPKRQTLKRKKTIDPQDTVEANNIQFEIRGEEEYELSETKDRLEEYQEKMRKTQLRYYVFKKITNYKSSLRRYFQRYRTIVQLMEAVEEKKEETKENDLETKNKQIKMLKNILKNRTYKEQRELNKYLLRFYYNCKYAAGIANLNKILNKEKNENKDNNENKNENKIESEKQNEIKNEIKNDENKKKEEINTNDNSNTNSNIVKENTNNNNEQANPNFLNAIKGEIKKEEEKKELSPEEIEKARRKRNKELRDLFYNKVRERQKWLHDHFVKFYYKGLLWAMKTGNIRNNTSSPSDSKPETASTSESSNTNTNININTNQTVETKPENSDNSKDNNNLLNKPSSEIDTLNINKEIEKKEEKKEEEKKEDEEKKNKKVAFNKIRDRSKGLRKLLSEKNKEKNNILRKYFFKFLSNGILLSLKKTTLKSSKTLSNIVDQTEGGEKDENAQKEEEENNWIIEEKKRRKLEEEQKQKELKEKITKIMVIIFNKKDQILCARQRSCLQKWNLRAKILAIGDLTVGFRKSKRGKGKKKIKKKDGKNKDKKENEEENEDNKEINENK